LIELLPLKATFAPDDDLFVEARGIPDGTPARLLHLDRVVGTAMVENGRAAFPPQAEGGYGVEVDGAATALDVLADPLSRPRYGFVSHYETGRETAGVAENVRRLHLNAVQFYDWMYRHAQLMPPQDEFEDALGQTVSLATVRGLATAVARAGSLPLAYAAVYAVGEEAWPEWQQDGLFHADGSPWMLADFLWNVDPSSERWLSHLVADLKDALGAGFAGFHLDQYGSPKWALRADGTRVDLSEAFPALVDRVADEVPEARLIFNNVNDFPTWATAHARQAVTYIEVWPPHTRLRHLAWLVEKARLHAPGRPVVLAAYLTAYLGDEAAAVRAEQLQLATVFSSGATVLLHGEERAVLTDPYYVRHGELSPEAQDATRRYFDFAVRYGDLLFDARAVDVSHTHFGGENVEVLVEAPVPVSADPDPGALWVRVIRVGGGLVVHLIDLSDQDDDTWDAGKRVAGVREGVRVSVLRRGAEAAALLASGPESPSLRLLDVERSERYDTVDVPPFMTWSLLQVREASV
jgi:dextranase